MELISELSREIKEADAEIVNLKERVKYLSSENAQLQVQQDQMEQEDRDLEVRIERSRAVHMALDRDLKDYMSKVRLFDRLNSIKREIYDSTIPSCISFVEKFCEESQLERKYLNSRLLTTGGSIADAEKLDQDTEVILMEIEKTSIHLLRVINSGHAAADGDGDDDDGHASSFVTVTTTEHDYAMKELSLVAQLHEEEDLVAEIKEKLEVLRGKLLSFQATAPRTIDMPYQNSYSRPIFNQQQQQQQQRQGQQGQQGHQGFNQQFLHQQQQQQQHRARVASDPTFGHASGFSTNRQMQKRRASVSSAGFTPASDLIKTAKRGR